MILFVVRPPSWCVLYQAHAADYTPHSRHNTEEGAMYCGHCGSLLPQGALFCGTCGKSVGAAAPSRVAFSTPERKSRRVWWLPSLPAALALIVLVYWCWNRLTTDNPPRPEVENTTTTSPAPRPPTRAEQYAMTLQQTYRNNGYDVSVLAFTNEKL